MAMTQTRLTARSGRSKPLPDPFRKYTADDDAAIISRNLPDSMLARSVGVSRNSIQQRRLTLRQRIIVDDGPTAAEVALLAQEIEAYKHRVSAAYDELRTLEAHLEAIESAHRIAQVRFRTKLFTPKPVAIRG